MLRLGPELAACWPAAWLRGPPELHPEPPFAQSVASAHASSLLGFRANVRQHEALVYSRSARCWRQRPRGLGPARIAGCYTHSRTVVGRALVKAGGGALGV